MCRRCQEFRNSRFLHYLNHLNNQMILPNCPEKKILLKIDFWLILVTISKAPKSRYKWHNRWWKAEDWGFRKHKPSVTQWEPRKPLSSAWSVDRWPYPQDVLDPLLPPSQISAAAAILLHRAMPNFLNISSIHFVGEWPSGVLFPLPTNIPPYISLQKESWIFPLVHLKPFGLILLVLVFQDALGYQYHVSPAMASSSKQPNHHLGAKTCETGQWSWETPTAVCSRLVGPGCLAGTTFGCPCWRHVKNNGTPKRRRKIAAKQWCFDGGISSLWRWRGGDDRSTRFNNWRVGTCRSWKSMDRFMASELCTSHSYLGFSWFY